MSADKSVRITGRHRTDAAQGTAYDIVSRHQGVVWVKPGHHRHAAESFAGDLSDNRDRRVSS